MTLRPFRNILRQAPRFSQLVRRREWEQALGVLDRSAHVRVEGRNSFRDPAAHRTHIAGPPSESPWAISGSSSGFVLVPCWLRLPGSAEAVWPIMSGADIRAQRPLTGSGLVCIRISMRQAVRQMTHDTYDFTDPDAPVKALTALCDVLVKTDSTVEVAGTPEIVVTNNPGTAARWTGSGGSTTMGTYLIPLGWISGGRIEQFISHPLQVTLKAGFPNITLLR